jgi:ribosome-binding protein aMBF1 (putative translation factor)
MPTERQEASNEIKQQFKESLWTHCEICGRDYNPQQTVMIASKIIGDEYFTWCENCHRHRQEVQGITMKQQEIDVKWLKAEVNAIRRALLNYENRILSNPESIAHELYLLQQLRR